MKVKEGRKKREKDPQVQSLLKALLATRALHPAKVTRAMPEGKKMGGGGVAGALTLRQRWNIKTKHRVPMGYIPPPPTREGDCTKLSTTQQRSMIT